MPNFKVLKPFAVTTGEGLEALTRHFPRPGATVALDESVAGELIAAGKIAAVEKAAAKASAPKAGPKGLPVGQPS